MLPHRNDQNYSCLHTCSTVVARVIRCFIILVLPSVDIHMLPIQKHQRDYSGNNK